MLARMVDTFSAVASPFVRLHFHLYKPIIHLYIQEMDCKVRDWEGEVLILWFDEGDGRVGTANTAIL